MIAEVKSCVLCCHSSAWLRLSLFRTTSYLTVTAWCKTSALPTQIYTYTWTNIKGRRRKWTWFYQSECNKKKSLRFLNFPALFFQYDKTFFYFNNFKINLFSPNWYIETTFSVLHSSLTYPSAVGLRVFPSIHPECRRVSVLIKTP